ncbi:hypothetical protein E2C01_057423 [Portunus trituberculatus]|uniref:Uncharacterized protein n=1 Tax=Portunus trituberculatus TaxID=210409 RepID=A0A5B7H106_PORTR|nr:hypothetical protein [Portunus trituberculatus]
MMHRWQDEGIVFECLVCDEDEGRSEDQRLTFVFTLRTVRRLGQSVLPPSLNTGHSKLTIFRSKK